MLSAMSNISFCISKMRLYPTYKILKYVFDTKSSKIGGDAIDKRSAPIIDIFVSNTFRDLIQYLQYRSPPFAELDLVFHDIFKAPHRLTTYRVSC